MGGPGVQRSTRFVQYLRDFGYEPIVLTIHTGEIIKMKSAYDESLLNYLPEGIEIHRVSSGIPFKLNEILIKLRLYRIVWFLLYPFFWERQALWPGVAYRKASELIEKHNIKLVYTSSGPFSALLLGLRLKKRMGVTWIADMRDPFTDAYAWSFPSRIHWKITRHQEKKVLSQTDKLIVNTEEVRRLYINRKVQAPEKIITITNGY